MKPFVIVLNVEVPGQAFVKEKTSFHVYLSYYEQQKFVIKLIQNTISCIYSGNAYFISINLVNIDYLLQHEW